MTIRLESSELEEVDAIAAQLVPGIRLARHEAARAAFVRGLKAIREQH